MKKKEYEEATTALGRKGPQGVHTKDNNMWFDKDLCHNINMGSDEKKFE